MIWIKTVNLKLFGDLQIILEIPDPPCPQVANPNPPRILIYEYPGDGSDDMGVFDGVGGYLPNASTTIVDVDNFEVRPFRFVIEDIDGDGDDEIIFVDRRADTGNYQFGVVSVDNIPDFADGTETWTIKSKGLDFPSLVGTGNKWDLAVVDNNIYLWNELTSDVHRINMRIPTGKSLLKLMLGRVHLKVLWLLILMRTEQRKLWLAVGLLPVLLKFFFTNKMATLFDF